MFVVSVYSPLASEPDHYHFDDVAQMARFLVINSGAYRCVVDLA